MMEKQGIVAPEVTPPAPEKTAEAAAVPAAPREKLIEQLDADFSKAAAEATRKSLR